MLGQLSLIQVLRFHGKIVLIYTYMLLLKIDFTATHWLNEKCVVTVVILVISFMLELFDLEYLNNE